MEEKKKIKVKLSTIVYLVIILVLIIALGVVYYLGFIKDNNSNRILDSEEIIEKNETPVNAQVSEMNNSIEEDILYNRDDISSSNLDIGNTTIETKPTKQDENIIMYLGMDISNAEPGIYMFGSEYKKYEEFYNTTYDIYENGKKQGVTKGEVEESEDMEGNICYGIKYEKKDFESAKDCIFVSCDYNVVPREYIDEKNIPSAVQSEFSDCDSIKMQSIDLDNDGQKEYLVSYSIVQDNMSGICLFDSNFNRISNLASRYDLYLSDFKGVTYMDIDKDSSMEVIINIPVAASCFRIGIYKYDYKTVEGEVGIFSLGA